MRQLKAFASHSLAAVLEAAMIAILIVGLIAVPVLAAKGGNGGGGKGGGKPVSGTSSITLVMVDGTGTEPTHGDTITFSVSTTETDRPFVSVNCYQAGTWVYSASVGFFPDYPWAQEFVLASTSWPSGAADCTAELYTSKDGRRTTTLATLDFSVAP